MHDQVRAEWRCLAAGLIFVPSQTGFDLAEPCIELFGATAICGGEAADHAAPAGRDHELDARDQKHRRRDQRQRETIAETLQSI
jgi:hypothetical protein